MIIFVLLNGCFSHVSNEINMSTILIDLNAKETIIYSVKTDLCKRLNICPATLWLWSKEGIKQTDNFIVCFGVSEFKNKSKVRPNAINNLKPRY